MKLIACIPITENEMCACLKGSKTSFLQLICSPSFDKYNKCYSTAEWLNLFFKMLIFFFFFIPSMAFYQIKVNCILFKLPPNSSLAMAHIQRRAMSRPTIPEHTICAAQLQNVIGLSVTVKHHSTFFFFLSAGFHWNMASNYSAPNSIAIFCSMK